MRSAGSAATAGNEAREAHERDRARRRNGAAVDLHVVDAVGAARSGGHRRLDAEDDRRLVRRSGEAADGRGEGGRLVGGRVPRGGARAGEASLHDAVAREHGGEVRATVDAHEHVERRRTSGRAGLVERERDRIGIARGRATDLEVVASAPVVGAERELRAVAGRRRPRGCRKRVERAERGASGELTLIGGAVGVVAASGGGGNGGRHRPTADEGRRGARRGCKTNNRSQKELLRHLKLLDVLEGQGTGTGTRGRDRDKGCSCLIS